MDPDVIINYVFEEHYHLRKKQFYTILELICKSLHGTCFGKSVPSLLGIIITDQESEQEFKIKYKAILQIVLSSAIAIFLALRRVVTLEESKYTW